MVKRAFASVAAALAWAAPVEAADFVVVAPGAVVVTEPTPLEWVRHVRPRIGRDTAVPVNGVLVPTIEWRRPVEVRVRTESGEPLTEEERRAVLDLAQVCDRGEVRDVSDLLERNGTYVVEYDCAWLQGFEDSPKALIE
jgi:hypothetical protein